MAGMPPARRRSPAAAPSPDISPADYGPHGSPEAMRRFAQYMQQGMAMQLDAGTRDLLRQELRQELRAEMRAELREEIRQEIIEAEVKARVAAEFESPYRGRGQGSRRGRSAQNACASISRKWKWRAGASSAAVLKPRQPSTGSSMKLMHWQRAAVMLTTRRSCPKRTPAPHPASRQNPVASASRCRRICRVWRSCMQCPRTSAPALRLHHGGNR